MFLLLVEAFFARGLRKRHGYFVLYQFFGSGKPTDLSVNARDEKGGSTRVDGGPIWPFVDRKMERDFVSFVQGQLVLLERNGELRTGLSRRSLLEEAAGSRFVDLLLRLSTIALRRKVFDSAPTIEVPRETSEFKKRLVELVDATRERQRDLDHARDVRADLVARLKDAIVRAKKKNSSHLRELEEIGLELANFHPDSNHRPLTEKDLTTLVQVGSDRSMRRDRIQAFLTSSDSERFPFSVDIKNLNVLCGEPISMDVVSAFKRGVRAHVRLQQETAFGLGMQSAMNLKHEAVAVLSVAEKLKEAWSSVGSEITDLTGRAGERILKLTVAQSLTFTSLPPRLALPKMEWTTPFRDPLATETNTVNIKNPAVSKQMVKQAPNSNTRRLGKLNQSDETFRFSAAMEPGPKVSPRATNNALQSTASRELPETECSRRSNKSVRFGIRPDSHRLSRIRLRESSSKGSLGSARSPLQTQSPRRKLFGTPSPIHTHKSQATRSIDACELQLSALKVGHELPMLDELAGDSSP